MKLKAFVLVSCLTLFGAAFAGSQHVHPKAEEGKSKSSVSFPGYCEIEIINRSFENVVVSGIFDDGLPLQPFDVYVNDLPHTISLYYYGYCHKNMIVNIDTWSGFRVYSAVTSRWSTITLFPYLKNKVKAQVSVKQ